MFIHLHFLVKPNLITPVLTLNLAIVPRCGNPYSMIDYPPLYQECFQTWLLTLYYIFEIIFFLSPINCIITKKKHKIQRSCVFSCLQFFRSTKMVEAAGIEPVSEDTLSKLSTNIAYVLNSLRTLPQSRIVFQQFHNHTQPQNFGCEVPCLVGTRIPLCRKAERMVVLTQLLIQKNFCRLFFKFPFLTQNGATTRLF